MSFVPRSGLSDWVIGAKWEVTDARETNIGEGDAGSTGVARTADDRIGREQGARPERARMSGAGPPLPEPTAAPRANVLFIGGTVARADIPALCERLGALLESSPTDAVVCDLKALARVDLATVEALARLQLTARRAGRQIRLRHASADLQALLVLTGLSEVFPLDLDADLDSEGPSLLAHEAQGQPEEHEEPRGVEEEGDCPDRTT